MKEVYDTSIVGGGPGGLNAHLFATRANMNSLLITGYNPGGQVRDTAFVENYLGFGKAVARHLI